MVTDNYTLCCPWGFAISANRYDVKGFSRASQHPPVKFLLSMHTFSSDSIVFAFGGTCMAQLDSHASSAFGGGGVNTGIIAGLPCARL